MVSTADQLRAEGRREMLLEQLKTRFTRIEPAMRARIEQASNEQVVEWARHSAADRTSLSDDAWSRVLVGAVDSAIHELRTEGRREILLEMIDARFGSIDSGLRARVDAALTEQLVAWARRILYVEKVEELFAV